MPHDTGGADLPTQRVRTPHLSTSLLYLSQALSPGSGRILGQMDLCREVLLESELQEKLSSSAL